MSVTVGEHPQAIFVTGAASGIGRATARLFAGRGWLVGLADADEAGLRAVAAELGPERACARRLDVTDGREFESAVAALTERTSGRLDVLFNCAGVLRCGPFERLSSEDDRVMLGVNVLGVLNGIRAALPALKRTPGARIISMSSSAALYGVPEEAVYSASKFAIRALTEALDLELERSGITVCDVMPPVVRTPMVTNQTFQPAVVKNLRHWITPEDVAEVVWKAAHGHRLHWVMSPGVRLLALVQRLFPFVTRPVMKRLSAHPAAR